MSERHVLVTVRRGPDAGATLVVRPGERAVIGRAPDATLSLRDDDASRHHVALVLGPGGLLVEDLGSRNGTVLGGLPLAPRTPTLAGPVDALRLGQHALELRLVEPSAGPSVQDDYELLREVGRGAAARVLAARHRATGRPVAIKMLLDRLAGGVGGRERLLREGEVARRIEDPNVVRVHEVRVEAEQVFVVMEWVDGPTAQQLVARGPLPVDRALLVAEGVARGLCAVHAAGVVHRDVKPTNVLLTSAGEVKLSDLGLCRELGPGGTLTATGVGMGTLAYVAPEQALDAKRATPLADLYSLGATLYHLLAGQPPFTGAGAELLIRVTEDEPPPLAAPPAVSRLVRRLLEKDPDDRLPTAAVVVKELARLRGA